MKLLSPAEPPISAASLGASKFRGGVDGFVRAHLWGGAARDYASMYSPHPILNSRSSFLQGTVHPGLKILSGLCRTLRYMGFLSISSCP